MLNLELHKVTLGVEGLKIGSHLQENTSPLWRVLTSKKTRLRYEDSLLMTIVWRTAVWCENRKTAAKS